MAKPLRAFRAGFGPKHRAFTVESQYNLSSAWRRTHRLASPTSNMQYDVPSAPQVAKPSKLEKLKRALTFYFHYPGTIYRVQAEALKKLLD